jgi:UDP-glucose 4-epimerase
MVDSCDTSREALLKFGGHLRLHPVVRATESAYTYERKVEEFLRWSPHVHREGRHDEPLGL